MTDLRQAAQQALEAWDDPMGMKDLCVAMDALRTALEQQQAEPVAWDVFELRLYGAPQEKQHRVLWVERYIYPDGSTPDLDSLLEAAKTEGGIDGRAKTLHVRPLYTTSPQRQWVGLTHAQAKEFVQAWDENDAYALCRAIEAKLKQKNNT